MLNKSVTPAQAGVQCRRLMDSGLRRNDDAGLIGASLGMVSLRASRLLSA